jgi:hypothetical protein
MISAQQASEALREAAATERRSRFAYSYAKASPHCFIWGIVWLLGYGAEALVPLVHPPGPWIGWWWMTLTLAGVATSIWIGRRQRARNGQPNWRMAALFTIIWLYQFATFAVLHPHDSLQVGAAIPLLTAAIYAAVGLWLGLRYILVGAFVALATLAGYFLLRDYFLLWMALVGGGALILTGFWLRRI